MKITEVRYERLAQGPNRYENIKFGITLQVLDTDLPDDVAEAAMRSVETWIETAQKFLSETDEKA